MPPPNESLNQLVARALSRWSPPSELHGELAAAYELLRAHRASGAAGPVAEHEAVARAKRAREMYLMAEHQRLAERCTVDLARIRTSMLPAYGALVAVGDPRIGLRSAAVWLGFLDELLPEPAPAEALAAYLAAAVDPLPEL